MKITIHRFDNMDEVRLKDQHCFVVHTISRYHALVFPNLACPERKLKQAFNEYVRWRKSGQKKVHLCQ